MAITTWAELKTAVSTYNPHGEIPGQVADLIALAESRFNRELRTRQMQATATGTTTAETATLSLPSDFLDLVELRIVTSSSYPLEKRPLADLYERQAGATSGLPQMFAINGDEVVLGPTPASAYDYALTYYQKIPALGSDNASNWLLDDAPDIYLFASLVEGERFLLNESGMAWWESQYSAARAALMGADRRSRWKGGIQRVRVA